MGSFSVWHWLIIIVWLAVFLVPGLKLVGRTGHSPLLGLLFIVPLVNIIFWWWLAFGHWPALDGQKS